MGFLIGAIPIILFLPTLIINESGVSWLNQNIPEITTVLLDLLRITVNFSLPHLIVIVIGSLIGVAEIHTTFRHFFIEAMSTLWGKTLLVVNSIAAEVVFLLIALQSSDFYQENQIVLAFAVGLGFPLLIRTRFTLKKGLDSETSTDFGFGLDRLYQAFQDQCKIGIDQELALSNKPLINKLIGTYSDIVKLYLQTKMALEIRMFMTEKEIQKEQEEIESLFENSSQEYDEFVRFQLARKILILTGKRYVDNLINFFQDEDLIVLDIDIKAAEVVEKMSLEELKSIANKNNIDISMAFSDNSLDSDDKKKKWIASILVAEISELDLKAAQISEKMSLDQLVELSKSRHVDIDWILSGSTEDNDEKKNLIATTLVESGYDFPLVEEG